MAQLRRYPNVLPSYLGSHNMNGNSERVEQREKAKIARVQTTDVETIKETTSSPLFPPPRKVSDSSDEITKTIKKSLGPYSNFVKIMHQEASREKAPGQTCIGVDPVPATPTENKTPYFPTSTNKTKAKEKPSNVINSQEKPKGNHGVEKFDQKHKSNSDSSRHKPLKLGEKLNDKKDNKDTKVVNKISLEKYKNNQATASVADKSNTLPINKQKSGASHKDVTTTNHISQELNNEPEKVVKKEDTSEQSHQEPIKKVEKSTPAQKTKPTPLQLPSQNFSSSSLLQSPQHQDMKVQNILKEMTEPVNMPLTGIFTPLPKQDSRFPFPGNVNAKENSGVSDPANSFIEDFHLSDDEDSDDEQENNDDQEHRSAGQTRSRSLSSSSSSSSGDSSDSEAEVADDNNTRPVRKTSMLNAMSPSKHVRKPPSPVQPVIITPKNETIDSSGKALDRTLPMQTSPNETSDEILGKTQTSSSKSDETNLLEKFGEEDGLKKDFKVSSIKVEENKSNEPKSDTKVRGSSPSAGQKHNHSLTRTKPETKESLPDTKIRIKVEKGGHDSFRVKTDSKVKGEIKKKSESDSKQVGEIKNNTERDKPVHKNGELNSKSSSKHDVKLKKNVNGVVTKIKKLNDSKDEKVETKKKDKKSEEPIVQKKNKRKHKDSTGESGKHTKDKSDLCSSKEKSDANGKDKTRSVDKTGIHSLKEKTDETSSKDTKRTKSGNKEKKKSDRTLSLGFDSPSDEVEDEEKVIDVVGDKSPVVKKKKTGNSENGVNGAHKNGHIDMPLGIQLVHDEHKDPASLIVKIPLSFLKRIPAKFGENLSVESSRTDVELDSLGDGGKRPKDSTKKNGENGNMDVHHTDEIFSEKKRHLNDHGKRSPSWDSGHVKKRLRRDSQRDKSNTEGNKCKTPAELITECEADIRKTEPDAHLLQAKTLKREADKLTDKEAKSRTYVEAVIRFICCGKALEDKEDGEVRACQMYSDTTELLRFILKHVLGKTEDKRLLILCLRVQSLLLHKIYRMKGKQTVRNTQILAEHFKSTHKNNMTSPYTTSNKHGSTPSPLSPTPSPAGSVGSIGSNGSNSSGEGNHTQNGRHASTASVTSPVSVSIPQRIHGVMAQHVSSTTKLVNSIDMWDKADSLTSNYKEFFTTVDSICGPLTFHSSIPHVVSYVKNSLSNFHEHDKET